MRGRLVHVALNSPWSHWSRRPWIQRTVREVTSQALDDQRNALPYSDAHRAEGIATPCRRELVHRCGDDSRPGHSEWMTNRNRTAVWIYVLGVVGKAKLAHDCQALRSEGFIELDHVHLADVEAGTTQRLATRRHLTDSHNPRFNTSGS